MKRIFILVLLSSLLISCTKILLLSKGIKQPALETHDRLAAFLAKQQLDATELLCFQDTNALHQFYGRRSELPSAHFFNRKKQFVDYREKPSECNAKVGVFIQKMDSINQIPADPALTLDNLITDLVYAADLRPFRLESTDYDVYLVIYWAKYLGKINKEKVFDWEALAIQAKQKGLKMRIIKITADYQALWGITEKQIPEFDY